jgi:ElaB/YqjD/DUF883 family membrane-anchored ribosome-binding protein
MPDEKIDQKRPVQAESELKKMQQRLIDDTVDDSFPASDPPAWTTTGSKSVAAKSETDDETQTSNEGASRILGQAEEMVRHVADQASSFARDTYRRGEQYIQEGRRRFPETERYYRDARNTIAQPVETHPISALIIAGAIGYGLAWFIHGRMGSSGSSHGMHRSHRGRRVTEAERRSMARREQAARSVG